MPQTTIPTTDMLGWFKQKPNGSSDTVLLRLQHQHQHQHQLLEQLVCLILQKIRANEYAIFICEKGDIDNDNDYISNLLLLLLAQANLDWHANNTNQTTHIYVFSSPLTATTYSHHHHCLDDKEDTICVVMDFLKEMGVQRIINPYSGHGIIGYIANIYNIDCMSVKMSSD